MKIIYLFVLAGNVIPAFADGYDKTAEEYDKVIKRLYTLQKMDSIKIVLDEALNLYPNDTDLNRWAGTYFLHKKETDNARYFLIKAVQQDTDNFLAKQQLVTLEEELGNLSSAICYVNEMLEMYPYDQALWKKKIGLYRKQGNHVEADRLLKRLCTIYPNDSIVENDYLNRLEEIYMQQRKEGNKNEAVNTLRTLLKHRSKEKMYYLDLANLLYQEGHSEEAVAVLSQGLMHFPSDIELLRKKAEFMADRGNSKEAVELLRKSKSASLSPIADELMIEAARAESWKDPYALYGKIYESRRTAEALDYLLRTSISRGYNEDALFYLSEYRKRYGVNPELLYKEYRVFKRMGDGKAAVRTLEKYVALNRNDMEMANELAIMKMERADASMIVKNYEEAIVDLKDVMRLSAENDMQNLAARKLVTCYLNTNKNLVAISFIDSIRDVRVNSNLYVAQKATALHKMERSAGALAEIESSGDIRTEAYEVIASEYIKRLIEEGAVKEAYNVSKNWTEKAPESKLGLIYAIRTSEGVGNYDVTDRYVKEGRVRYPDESFFVVKEAAAMYRKKAYQSGIDLLTSWVDSLPGNRELVAAYSAHVEMRAGELLKEKKTNEALSIIEHALLLDGANQGLLYAQGEAYEMSGDYEAAYSSYVKFRPEALWIKEHKRKLMAVRRKGYKNVISTDVLTGWYSDGGHPNTIISAAYTRKMKKDYLTATVNISNRHTDYIEETVEVDDVETMGMQFRADWGHTFNSRWSTMLSLAAANRLFPSWLGQVGAFYMFPKDIELGVILGYRKNYTPSSLLPEESINAGNMYNLRLSGGLYRDLWRMNANCDGFVLNNTMYFNVNSQFRYYPNYDGNTHLMASVGVGTAPEIDFVDKLMPGSFEHINFSLGLGGVYMVSDHISLGITASYHYFYNETDNGNVEENMDKVITSYKNQYDIYAQIMFCF